MQRKNTEALTTCDSQGFGVSNFSRASDMKIIAKSDLNFHGTALIPVSNITGTWLTSSDLAKALQYANSRAVTMIYNKYADEFSSGMSQVLEVSTTGNYRKKVRVFSLRGAHLIAMFARTDIAKEFRRWVLDILDREVAQGNINPVFDFDMYAHNTRVAQSHMEVIYKVWKEQLSPSLRAIGSPLASSLEDRIKAAASLTYGLNRALGKVSKNGSRIH